MTLQVDSGDHAQRRALVCLTDGDWQGALARYGAIAKAEQLDGGSASAGVGIARALASGGYLREALLVLDGVFRQFRPSESEYRQVVDAVLPKPQTAGLEIVEPELDIGQVAADAGLLVWRHSRWWGAYITLMLVVAVLPLVAGVRQEHYAMIGFAALAGGGLIHLYVVRHWVPLWRAQAFQAWHPQLVHLARRATAEKPQSYTGPPAS